MLRAISQLRLGTLATQMESGQRLAASLMAWRQAGHVVHDHYLSVRVCLHLGRSMCINMHMSYIMFASLCIQVGHVCAHRTHCVCLQGSIHRRLITADREQRVCSLSPWIYRQKIKVFTTRHVIIKYFLLSVRISDNDLSISYLLICMFHWA